MDSRTAHAPHTQVLSAIAGSAWDWRPESKGVQDALSLCETDQRSNDYNGHQNCDRNVSFRYSLPLTVSRYQPSAPVIHESASEALSALEPQSSPGFPNQRLGMKRPAGLLRRSPDLADALPYRDNLRVKV